MMQWTQGRRYEMRVNIRGETFEVGGKRRNVEAYERNQKRT